MSPSEQRKQTKFGYDEVSTPKSRYPSKVVLKYAKDLPPEFGDIDNKESNVNSEDFTAARPRRPEPLNKSIERKQRLSRQKQSEFEEITQKNDTPMMVSKPSIIKFASKKSSAKEFKRVVKAVPVTIGAITSAVSSYPLQLTGFGVMLFGLGLGGAASSIIDTVSGVVSYIPFIGGIISDYISSASTYLAAPGLAIFVVGYAIIVVLGIMLMSSTFLAYLIRGVDCLGGLKSALFITCIVMYLTPILNIFPWIIAWVLVVQYQATKSVLN